MKSTKRQHGFTLIELAIVLVIIGVLIGSFIGTITQRLENARVAETEDKLEEIKTAILGYAYTNRALPCPDCFDPVVANCLGAVNAPRDGIEDRTAAGLCSVNNLVGTVPWVTLGLAQGDAWANRYRYWVDANYVDDSLGGGSFFALDAAEGAGQILERSADGTLTPQLADNIVAVVISHGKNAYAGVSTSGINRPGIPAANLDEIDNLDSDGDNDFISRPPTDINATTAGGEFDDILMWITEFELKAKMVEAGRLP